MHNLLRRAILTELCDRLSQYGSWCGETHLQKAVYFLQEVLSLPTRFDFVLYKHGPFSFDLRDELSSLRAYGLLNVRPRPFPYGPSLETTEASRRLRKALSRTLETHIPKIDKLCRAFRDRTAGDLEKLATVLYVRRTEGEKDEERIAKRVHELKPHIPIDDARSAVEEFNALVEQL